MTTTTLRPNATGTVADSVTGAASEHAATSDDSDASYYTDNDIVRLDMETFTLGTDVTKQARLRVRFRQNTPGSNPQFYGDVVIVGNSFEELILNTQGSGSFATVSSSYWAKSWSQADINKLRARTYDGSTLGSGYGDLSSWDVAEIYVDVVHVPIPVVAVDAVSPDPYTASTAVPLSWVNTLDTDGGAQTHYQVRVFDATTYGASFTGLDPDSDTPYYDSGAVVSSAGSATAGPLETGDTYRAYVRVAQTVNGAKHWSAWDYDEFDVSVSTADVDTVTLSADNNTGSIEVTVARDAGGEAWEWIEVQRSIDGGSTWTDVRFATFVDATGDADEFVVTDYEVPNGTTTSYRARATYFSSGLPVTGSWVSSSTTSWSSTDCWLKDPTSSANSTTFRYAGRDPFTRTRRSGVFPVLSAAAPVVVSDVRSTRSGTLTVETLDASTAANINDVLDSAQVILVQFPASMDIADAYIVVTDDADTFQLLTADEVRRLWTLSYVETTAPADVSASSAAEQTTA